MEDGSEETGSVEMQQMKTLGGKETYWLGQES